MLIKAVEELKIGQDYRYSLLLAFFSIEQVVTDFLEDIKGRAGISEKTIKNYVSGLLSKLGMGRRTEAAVFAARLMKRTTGADPES